MSIAQPGRIFMRASTGRVRCGRAVENHPIIVIAASVFMLAASISDLRHRRISNRLNLIAVICGLCLQAAIFGVAGVVIGLQGFAAGLAILLIPYAMGMIGGGDVKFVAAIGTFLGAVVTLTGLAMGVVLGGFVGAFSLLRSGQLASGIRSVLADLGCLAGGVRPARLEHAQAVETVPYGVLLAVGMIGGVAVSVMEVIPWASR